MRLRPLLLLALSGLTGCGSAAAPTPEAGPPDHPGADASGSDAGGSPGDGALPRDESPITERRSTGTFQCRIERDRTDHRPRSWSVYPPALVVTTAGKSFLARLESMASDPLMPPPAQLVVSSFDVAGTFGPPTSIPLAAPTSGSSVTAAPRGDGFVVAWVDGTKLRLAAFDAAGQMVLPPRDVLAGIDAGAGPVLAAGAGGSFGLVYAPEIVQGSREVRFAVLDAAGAVRMSPRALTGMPGTTFASPAPAIAATGSGYAMIWRDPSSMAGGIDFAAADAGGREVVPRHRVSAPVEAGLVVGGVGGLEPATNALLPSAGGFLAAWVEGRRADNAGAGSVVRLARLDASGNRLGDAASLRRFEADVDEVEPTLVRFADAVAVMWARGSHIYICAGCVPDHRIDLLLVDPATLAPLSDVVSLTNGGDPRAGGLLRHGTAVVGSSLLTTYLLTFHVNTTPGSAAFGCAKR